MGPEGFRLRVSSGTGLLNTTLPAILTENAAGGTYVISFEHADREGSTIEEIEFSDDNGANWYVATGPDGFTPISISNVCAYPVLEFDPTLASSYCKTGPAITLGARFDDTVNNPAPLFTPAANTTLFTINGAPETVLDPALLTGTILVSGNYTPSDGTGVNGTNGTPAISINGSTCPVSIEQIITILNVNCGTFPWGGNE
jgi:hypothetical protein